MKREKKEEKKSLKGKPRGVYIWDELQKPYKWYTYYMYAAQL